jgi:hypothetical protein
LLAKSNKGDVIQGAGGLRKVRVAAKGKGKRGGARVIYYHFDEYNRFYLLTIYVKNETTDLTRAQKNQLKDFMDVWKHEQT